MGDTGSSAQKFERAIAFESSRFIISQQLCNLLSLMLIHEQESSSVSQVVIKMGLLSALHLNIALIHGPVFIRPSRVLYEHESPGIS
jgi:hypothetical protein